LLKVIFSYFEISIKTSKLALLNHINKMEIDYFIEFYKNVDRQGPGDDKYTQKAYEMLEGIPTKPKILDVGCGSGKQTMVLASLCKGEIIAVDYYDCFLDELKVISKKAGHEKQIKPMQASMLELPFKNGEFDLIWSEGAIYIMGFENGLKAWKKFLKPDGYIVVSEISWIRPNPPKEILDFWNAAYPEMGTISHKINVIENCGYQALGHLILPEYGWTENYYFPLERKTEIFLKKYGDVPEAREIVSNEIDTELALYRKYKEFYSYVFYVMKKI
jgi:ubiquinone/menaquinone biosynthesis C-methylase UbiE